MFIRFKVAGYTLFIAVGIIEIFENIWRSFILVGMHFSTNAISVNYRILWVITISNIFLFIYASYNILKNTNN